MRKFNSEDSKKRIRELRRSENLTQEEMGAMLGMSKSGYNIAEKTKNPTRKLFFTIEQLINIKYTFNTSYDYIIEGIKSVEEPSIQLQEIGLLNKKIEDQQYLIQEQKGIIALLKEQFELIQK